MSAGKWRPQHVREVLSEALASPQDLALADSREPPIWEQCCFCVTKHKDGVHMKRDPRNPELCRAYPHCAAELTPSLSLGT